MTIGGVVLLVLAFIISMTAGCGIGAMKANDLAKRSMRTTPVQRSAEVRALVAVEDFARKANHVTGALIILGVAVLFAGVMLLCAN